MGFALPDDDYGSDIPYMYSDDVACEVMSDSHSHDNHVLVSAVMRHTKPRLRWRKLSRQEIAQRDKYLAVEEAKATKLRNKILTAGQWPLPDP